MAQPCKLERPVGIITAYVFVWINKYYSDYKHKLYAPFHASRLADESVSPNGGLFGTAVAAMEMLSTAAYLLMTMDLFGLSLIMLLEL
ncbi:hypothetical protein ACOSQ4_021604 [Xanthoceras sorbifolium]